MFNQEFNSLEELKKVRKNTINFLTYMGHNKKKSKEQNEERVINLVKGEFELFHGMTFYECLEIYNHLVKNNPEKLI